MINMIVGVRRLPELTRKEFSDHWKEHHAELIQKCSNFNRHIETYIQYHHHEERYGLAALFGSSGEYDGIAILKFKNKAAMEKAFMEPDYLVSVQPDEARFVDLDNCSTFICAEEKIL